MPTQKRLKLALDGCYNVFNIGVGSVVSEERPKSGRFMCGMVLAPEIKNGDFMDNRTNF